MAIIGRMAATYDEFVKEFWSRADTVGECLVWRGHKSKDGHSRVRVFGRQRAVHQIAFNISGRLIPEGMVVRHSCDVGSCINPLHLELGTQLDNVRDMVSRGRVAKGEKNGASKYTPETVVRVRAMIDGGASIRATARALGVPKATVWGMSSRRSWGHVA